MVKQRFLNQNLRRGLLGIFIGLAFVSLAFQNCGISGNISDSDLSANSSSAPLASSEPTPTPAPSISVSGSTVPSLTQLLDAQLNIWTLSAAGVVYKNGSPAGTPPDTILLLYFNGIIYAQSEFAAWYLWNGSAWTQIAADPRPLTPSASGATIPSSLVLVDSQLNEWTVAGGVVYKNGSTGGFSASVILLLYYNNIIYQENNSKNWWSWNGTTWVAVTQDPRL